MMSFHSLVQRASAAHANRSPRAFDPRQHRLILPLVVNERDVLTWQKVSDEFERLGPAPTETVNRPLREPPTTSAD